jgi:hypothetical protein
MLKYKLVCVCVYSVFVLSCVWVAALRWADHSSKESTFCIKILRNWRRGQGPAKGCRAIDDLMYEWMNEWWITYSLQRRSQYSSHFCLYAFHIHLPLHSISITLLRPTILRQLPDTSVYKYFKFVPRFIHQHLKYRLACHVRSGSHHSPPRNAIDNEELCILRYNAL